MGALLFGAATCSDLIAGWMNDPQNRWGLPAFLVWVLFLVLGLWASRKKQTPDALFLGGGIFIILIGNLGSLNVLQHIGFSLVAVSALQQFPARVLAGGGALAWMPVFGWAAAHFLSIPGDPWRVPLTGLTGIALLFIERSA